MTSKPCTYCGEEKPIDDFEKHRNKCKQCRSAYNRARYQSRDKDSIRHNAYVRTYGITLAQYDALLAEQGGCCSICKSQDAGGKGRFHVDHSHITGKVRGLLCHFCNTGLGKFRDSQELLHAAADYLARTD